MSVTYPPLLAYGSKLRAFGAPLSIIVSILAIAICNLKLIKWKYFNIKCQIPTQNTD